MNFKATYNDYSVVVPMCLFCTYLTHIQVLNILLVCEKLLILVIRDEQT